MIMIMRYDKDNDDNLIYGYYLLYIMKVFFCILTLFNLCAGGEGPACGFSGTTELQYISISDCL